MNDCLAVVRALLAGETADHDGEVLSVHGARVTPAPAVPVPIVVGGRSDAALRRAARLGDGWLGVFVTPERWGESRARVETAAGELGRAEGGLGARALGVGGIRRVARRMRLLGSPRRWRISTTVPSATFAVYSPHGTPDDVAAQLAPYFDAGCRTFNLIPVATDDQTAIDGCAHVGRELTRPRQAVKSRPRTSRTGV